MAGCLFQVAVAGSTSTSIHWFSISAPTDAEPSRRLLGRRNTRYPYIQNTQVQPFFSRPGSRNTWNRTQNFRTFQGWYAYIQYIVPHRDCMEGGALGREHYISGVPHGDCIGTLYLVPHGDCTGTLQYT